MLTCICKKPEHYNFYNKPPFADVPVFNKYMIDDTSPSVQGPIVATVLQYSAQ